MTCRAEILRTAWADYRRDVFMGWGVRRGEPFNRGHFAYCLRMAWAAAKARAARVVVQPKPAALCVDPIRAAEIRAELRDMQFADFINWNRHAALGAELASIHA